MKVWKKLNRALMGMNKTYIPLPYSESNWKIRKELSIANVLKLNCNF